MKSLSPVTAFGAVLTMLLWAICYPLIALSLPYAPLMATAFFRALTAGSTLILIAALLRRPVPRHPVDYAYIGAIGFTATTIGFWAMFYAGSLVSPGIATVIANSQPLIAAALGFYLLNESIGKPGLLGMILGFTGIVVVSLESLTIAGSAPAIGIGFVIVAAAGIAVSNILLKKVSLGIDIFYAMGLQLLFGSIPLGMLALFQTPVPMLEWSPEYIVIVLTMAMLGTALPFALWFWLMSKAPLYKLNVFSFLTPVFGLYFGYAFFSESLSLIQWLGILLILAAIPLVTLTSSD